jgi:biotin carboxyl carrier protein
MKMENHITAPRDGVVTKLLAEAGAVVQQGEGLFVIAAPDA